MSKLLFVFALGALFGGTIAMVLTVLCVASADDEEKRGIR